MDVLQKGEGNKTIDLYFVDADDNGIDISGTATKTIKLQKPSGEDVSLTASFISGGTTGGLRYTVGSDATFFDETGIWQAQGFADDWKTGVGQFLVEDNL